MVVSTTFSHTHGLLGVAKLAPMLNKRPRMAPKYAADLNETCEMAMNSVKMLVRVFQQLSVLPSER